jgi:hypothetical protein
MPDGINSENAMVGGRGDEGVDGQSPTTIERHHGTTLQIRAGSTEED